MSERLRIYREDAENPDYIPTRDEIVRVIGMYAKDWPLTREEIDESGEVYLLIATEGDDKVGEATQCRYQRKGKFDKNKSSSTDIQIVFLWDGDAVGGKTVATYNDVTGQWSHKDSKKEQQ